MNKTANSFQGYNPFAQPALPTSLLSAVGLHANEQARPDTHLLAALAPQTNLFFERRRPDPGTHALITALLTEGGGEGNDAVSGEEGEEVEEFGGEEEKDAEIKAASQRLSGFMATLAGRIDEELKKRASAPVGDGRDASDGPGTNTGHGHVWTRPDGVRMRCMPSKCAKCHAELAKWGDSHGWKAAAIKTVGVGTAEAQLSGQVPNSAGRAMDMAKRRGGYTRGTPARWRPLVDSSTVASTVASTVESKAPSLKATEFASKAASVVLAHIGIGSAALDEKGQSSADDAFQAFFREGHNAIMRRFGLPEKQAASSILQKLLEAKGSSDKRDYPTKHKIMRELMSQRPAEFDREEPVKGIQGITHKPTGFRLHLPKQVVPQG